MRNYRRYSKFVKEGKSLIVPFVSIPERSSDFYETYIAGVTRMDLLSYKYYNDPNYDWLILQANPEYGSLEFNIPNKSLLRIPYPLEATMSQYYSDIDKYKELYGFN